jgi:hypothetical protein
MVLSPYKHVILGNGTYIYEVIRAVHVLDLETNTIEFFGDIDGSGLEMVSRLKDIIVEVDESYAVEMAIPFYERAIKLYGEMNYHVSARRRKFKWRKSHLELPPVRFRPFIRELYNVGERVPQEIVNYVEIKDLLSKMIARTES